MTLSNPAQYISGRTVQEQMNSLIDYVDQRAADVALDAIASDVAQVHSDAADAHTDALAAAASAAAAAGTLANAVKKTGEASQSIAGDIAVAGNLDGGTIGSGSTPVTAGDLTAYGSVSLDDTTLQGNLSVADPSALINLSGAGSVTVPAPSGNTDAATKKYVDDQDALKISITDVNTYAVGLTGNQTVAGVKTFTSYIVGITVGTRVRGQFVQNKWYDLGKINESGRYLIEAKIALTSGTFDTYSLMNVTLGPTIKVRRQGTLTASNWAGSGIATAKNSSNETRLLLKGYDNRWVTEVQVMENFRQGNPCNFEPTVSPVAQDDLSAYTGIVYGDDVS